MIWGLLFPACFDNVPSSYEIRNTVWLAEDPVSADLIRLRFSVDSLDISYGDESYPQITTYSYNAREFQGSIHIDPFIYQDGTVELAVWLFTVSRSTETLRVKLFSNEEKESYNVTFTRES